MGCGASILHRRPDSKRARLHEQRDIVTPPESRSRAGGLNKRVDGLTIDASVPSRNDMGIAETPVGKQADEYKYYCPLCM